MPEAPIKPPDNYPPSKEGHIYCQKCGQTLVGPNIPYHPCVCYYNSVDWRTRTVKDWDAPSSAT